MQFLKITLKWTKLLLLFYIWVKTTCFSFWRKQWQNSHTFEWFWPIVFLTFKLVWLEDKKLLLISQEFTVIVNTVLPTCFILGNVCFQTIYLFTCVCIYTCVDATRLNLVLQVSSFWNKKLIMVVDYDINFELLSSSSHPSFLPLFSLCFIYF